MESCAEATALISYSDSASVDVSLEWTTDVEWTKDPYGDLSSPSLLDLSHSDLVRLLSYLEGELQAREIVIAALVSEKSERIFDQATYGHSNDPSPALQRDEELCGEWEDSDELNVEQLYTNQLRYLEGLISIQRSGQGHAKQILRLLENQHDCMVQHLERESVVPSETSQLGALLEMECEQLTEKLHGQVLKNNTMKVELEGLWEDLTSLIKRRETIILYLLWECEQLWTLVDQQNGLSERDEGDNGDISALASDGRVTSCNGRLTRHLTPVPTSVVHKVSGYKRWNMADVNPAIAELEAVLNVLTSESKLGGQNIPICRDIDVTNDIKENTTGNMETQANDPQNDANSMCSEESGNKQQTVVDLDGEKGGILSQPKLSNGWQKFPWRSIELSPSLSRKSSASVSTSPLLTLQRKTKSFRMFADKIHRRIVSGKPEQMKSDCN